MTRRVLGVNDRNRVTLECDPAGRMTKQAPKEECNINNIMAKYQKSGAIEHVTKHAARYLDVSAVDFTTAELVVAGAKSMFEELPSSLRAKFKNDTAIFLEFVADPANQEQLQQLGLWPKDPEPETPDPVVPSERVESDTPPAEPVGEGVT